MCCAEGISHEMKQSERIAQSFSVLCFWVAQLAALQKKLHLLQGNQWWCDCALPLNIRILTCEPGSSWRSSSRIFGTFSRSVHHAEPPILFFCGGGIWRASSQLAPWLGQGRTSAWPTEEQLRAKASPVRVSKGHKHFQSHVACLEEQLLFEEDRLWPRL